MVISIDPELDQKGERLTDVFARYAAERPIPADGIVVYDLEIIRGIPKKGEPRSPDIEYCSGWDDHANMGVACLCAFDGGAVLTGEVLPYRVFTDPTAWRDFLHMVFRRPWPTTFWGYNNVRFDNKVLAASGWDVPRLCGDLLAELWAHAGLSRDKYSRKSHGGYTLDNVAKVNGLGGKSGSGGHAPILWQRGFHGRVIDYCLKDVALTTKLVANYIAPEVGINSPSGKVVSVSLCGASHA
jgi:hypothetical protein